MVKMSGGWWKAVWGAFLLFAPRQRACQSGCGWPATLPPPSHSSHSIPYAFILLLLVTKSFLGVERDSKRDRRVLQDHM